MGEIGLDDINSSSSKDELLNRIQLQRELLKTRKTDLKYFHSLGSLKVGMLHCVDIMGGMIVSY